MIGKLCLLQARCLFVQTLRLNKVGKVKFLLSATIKAITLKVFGRRGAGKMAFFKKKSYLQSNFSTKPLVSGAVHV